MNGQENKEWLDSLKEGDTVCYYTRWNGYIPIKILKITPKGWIKTEKNLTFKDGHCRVDTWTYHRIEPISEKVERYMWRQKAEKTVSDIKANNLSDEQLAAILEVLNIRPKANESAE